MENLEPTIVWNNFANICAIPRPSKSEEKIRQDLIDFANRLNLDYKVTEVGNIVINKEAVSGFENKQKVTLQAHMDMVPAKLHHVIHDFRVDPIQTIIDGDWIRSSLGTTLGADNGIGLAYILAILEAKNINHGPIEALITVDEEAGMTGAFSLKQSDISGDILLNLDSENDMEVCIGCAGGINTNINIPVKRIRYNKTDKICYKIILDGLYSGHSGCDIHLNRANAIKEMASVLLELQSLIYFELSHINGGKLRNVIPGYCEAFIVIENYQNNKLIEYIKHLDNILKQEFSYTDPNLNLSFENIDLPDDIIDPLVKEKFIFALNSVFDGVYRMDTELNIAETSSNIGFIKSYDDKIEIISLQRSPNKNNKLKIAKRIASSFLLLNAHIEHDSDYPGWIPNLNSKALALVKDSYLKLFGHDIKVSATHGGLECGLIVDKVPNIDAISIGATIKDPHSANERVSISSVQKTWKLIQEFLLNVPSKNE
jgi:dipeptidase D